MREHPGLGLRPFIYYFICPQLNKKETTKNTSYSFAQASVGLFVLDCFFAAVIHALEVPLPEAYLKMFSAFRKVTSCSPAEDSPSSNEHSVHNSIVDAEGSAINRTPPPKMRKNESVEEKALRKVSENGQASVLRGRSDPVPSRVSLVQLECINFYFTRSMLRRPKNCVVYPLSVFIK